jgi:hypothetical protein
MAGFVCSVSIALKTLRPRVDDEQRINGLENRNAKLDHTQLRSEWR